MEEKDVLKSEQCIQDGTIDEIYNQLGSESPPYKQKLIWHINEFSSKNAAYLWKKMEKIGINEINDLRIYQNDNFDTFRRIMKTSLFHNISCFYVELDRNNVYEFKNFHRSILKFIPIVTKSLSLRYC
ncbi:unnamed protein product [Moneuplotes crassus]|uniref:Uncharacterized protein n=1 Tax=Euplotes crassus TaxID=5936 RepID=A0AAD2D576_EUPCR|nr:unnamed protein product [Moneuplotes crassus]